MIRKRTREYYDKELKDFDERRLRVSVEGYEWFEYKEVNFTIISDVGPSVTVTLDKKQVKALVKFLQQWLKDVSKK